MASPQVENGYTKVANELLDALMRVSMSQREYRVFLAILRKTYGWSRKQAAISKAELARMAGLSRQNIDVPLNRLLARNMVVCINTNSQCTNYSIQKDYQSWRISTNAVHQRQCAYSISTNAFSSINNDAPLLYKEKKERLKKESRPDFRFASPREIPKNFQITDSLREWFEKQNFKFIEIKTATDEFVDHWKSTGERKKDWGATWRNGMRLKEKWAKQDAQKGKNPKKPKQRSIDAFQGKDYGTGTPDDQLPDWMRDN